MKNVVRHSVRSLHRGKHEDPQVRIGRHPSEHALAAHPRLLGEFNRQFGYLFCCKPEPLHPLPSFVSIWPKRLHRPVVAAEKYFAHKTCVAECKGQALTDRWIIVASSIAYESNASRNRHIDATVGVWISMARTGRLRRSKQIVLSKRRKPEGFEDFAFLVGT